MKRLSILSICILSIIGAQSQQSYDITFDHDSLTVFATFITPTGNGPFPTIIINAGSGPNDRDGTLAMVGGNVSCLYPNLLNDTLRPYKDLAEALRDSGFAVLRYDKLEYTYSNNLGNITFRKIWLPVASAIDYVKTRNDVDTNRLILIGHSEGSSLIPFIARDRNDIQALVSIAGPRRPLDSLLAYQLVNIAQTCGGNVAQAQMQANQILNYFNNIRTSNWDSNTPDLFGAPASTWDEYTDVIDSVVYYYDINNLPTLFIGLQQDINVPPIELMRLQNEINIAADFYSIPDLNHYMTTNNNPQVSPVLTDTIIDWLRKNVLTTSIETPEHKNFNVRVYPNPSTGKVVIATTTEWNDCFLSIKDLSGKTILSLREGAFSKSIKLDISSLNQGMYLLEITDGYQRIVMKIIKQ